MNAQDLRIGNLVTDKFDKIFYVESILSGSLKAFLQSEDREILFEYTLSDVKGIELTPSWLERCGFVPVAGVMNLYMQYGRSLSYEGVTLRLHVDAGITFLCNIEYLHQLQNLYYSLTGKELTLKP